MIPHTLWQTWKTHDVPVSLQNSYQSWATSNPGLDRRLCDDEECADFILEHFGSETHATYMAFAQPIQRADFWRLAVIYVHGGYYADLDVACWTPLSDLVPAGVQAVWTQEIDNISNFFFGARAGHPVIKAAMDQMLEQARTSIITDVQSFGMHWLHHSVRHYYKVIGTDYTNTDQVVFLKNEQLKDQNKLVHAGSSGQLLPDYESWRHRHAIMLQEREAVTDTVFVTTFHQHGYELYGREWVRGFTRLANYYPRLRARVYYQGFEPEYSHPNIEWLNFDQNLPMHSEWKQEYLSKTTHHDYVQTMTVRFSHKAFVIQHALDTINSDYVVWLDGDCVFKNADYANWPVDLIEDKFMACQVEHNHDLNHVESGILIFNAKNPDTAAFNQLFKQNYSVLEVLSMGQPYDGFIVYRTLLMLNRPYVNLNETHGAGGIQSDPGCTFLHPDIANKFVHNIGWTGKTQYNNWKKVLERDDIYKKLKHVLFGNMDQQREEKKQQAREKLASLKRIQNRINK